MSWTVIVPVKRLAAAKTRLRGALSGVAHRDLVLAMTLDTVSAALACPAVAGVLVVTDDPAVSAAATALGAAVVNDLPDAGLNPALAHAAATLVRTGDRRSGQKGVAALTADLPAVRPGELAGALRRAERAAAGPGRSVGLAGADPAGTPVRSYVTDAAGTGTVLLAAPPGVPLDPRFGSGSAPAHAASGAVALPGRWPGLRRDVDTAADLAEAVALGVGRHTAAVLAGTQAPDR